MQTEHRKRTVMLATKVRLVCDSLQWAINSRSAYTVVGTARTTQELIHLATALRPDIVLAESAIARAAGLIEAIARTSSATKLIAFGVANEQSEILACAEAGVSGYVLREASFEDLIHALDAALRGEVVCPPAIVACAFARIANLAADRRGPSICLPDRQSQILALIEEGLSNKEIARRLGIELSTVKNHVHALLIKLGVHRRSQAIARYRLTQAAALGTSRSAAAATGTSSKDLVRQPTSDLMQGIQGLGEPVTSVCRSERGS